ncbi:MAG: hypothetical protein HY842_01730 [Bacteroidetes bacterium]|nr:hypothetical protein [Bacteroidota bacterium]
MKNSDELREELEGSPFLQKMKDKGEGFKVPANYFKNLPDEVWKQVKPAAPPQESWLDKAELFLLFLQNLWRPRYVLAVATIAAVAVAAVCFFAEKTPGNESQPIAAVRLADISDEELQAYVSDNIGDFDRALFTENDLAEQEVEPHPQQPAPAKPNLEEMEKYLDEVIDEIDVEDLEKLL